ncbi:hypothetical protein [Albidovulum sediminis]|uniref:Uncharacterized protein n=1 Tax=Albidovulum sediminis TaxID=3066345 RepID=A0ABT2NP25_9RHOB|nr:hypothetical protein [Defluviimonas sediminis]MCT8329684.1 hypothetical protein [Defluviimonas sediminis]
MCLLALFSVNSGGYGYAQTIPYQSDEFNDPDSRIPAIFACMFAGHQSGLDVAATETAVDFLLDSGIAPEQIDTWAHDATIYVSRELAETDMASFWKRECETQFANMRAAMSQ